LPPSINNSAYEFSIQKNGILFGLGAIKGIGQEIANKILQVRKNVVKFKDYLNAIALLSKNGIGAKTIELLIKAGCFDEFLIDKTKTYLLTNLEEIFNKSKTTTTDGKFIIDPQEVDVIETNEQKELLQKEQNDLLGVNFSAGEITKLLSSYTGEKELTLLNKGSFLPEGSVFRCLAKLLSYKEIKTKTNLSMAFAKISDDTKTIDVTLFTGVYNNVKSMLYNEKLYIVTIKVGSKGLNALDFKQYNNE
jgi:DNA polymerase-3 subunit alpha